MSLWNDSPFIPSNVTWKDPVTINVFTITAKKQHRTPNRSKLASTLRSLRYNKRFSYPSHGMISQLAPRSNFPRLRVAQFDWATLSRGKFDLRPTPCPIAVITVSGERKYFGHGSRKCSFSATHAWGYFSFKRLPWCSDNRSLPVISSNKLNIDI